MVGPFRSYKESIDLISNQTAETKNEEKNDIVEKKIIEEQKIIKPEIVFKVQIGTYLKEMKNSERFKELKVEEKVVNGTYKYFVGNTSSKKKADSLRNSMVEKGFNDAFIIALKGG